MDSLTHLVAGALTPLAFSRAHRQTSLIIFGILAGEFPDIDSILGNSPKVLLALHRGLSHALAAQPVWAAILATVFYLWMQKKRTKKTSGPASPPLTLKWHSLFLMALVALCVHLYLDCMTTFGTQILLPFSQARVWFPAVFIIDPVLTLPPLVLLLLALFKKLPLSRLSNSRSKLYAGIGLAWLVLYPLAALAVNHTATTLLAPRFASKPESQLSLLTEPFSPLVWKAIVEKSENLEMASFSLLDLSDLPIMQKYPKADPELLSILSAQNEIFNDFMKFGTYFTQTVRPGPGLSLEYSFMELRYIVSDQSLLRKLGRTKTNFILEARVTPNGKLLAWRFLTNSSNNPDWRTPDDQGR